jgi:hypothetical protein
MVSGARSASCACTGTPFVKNRCDRNENAAADCQRRLLANGIAYAVGRHPVYRYANPNVRLFFFAVDTDGEYVRLKIKCSNVFNVEQWSKLLRQ